MPKRSIVTAAVLAATAALIAVGAQPAVSAARVSPPPGTRLLLTFDQHESLDRGTLVRDSSGHRHGGVVLARNGGELRPVAGWIRRGAAFPGRCCARAIIQVRDNKGLDPGRRPFVFGAAVKIGPARASTASNVMQKGFFKQAGGQYKLQLLAGGAPSCVVFGSRGRVILNADKSIADRRWHRLTCLRTATRVQLRVDGKVVAGTAQTPGLISNNAPVRVGGKKVTVGNQQYRGAIDSVFLRLL
jgi:hypothetical protein